jgi:hypothetical protein
LEEREPGQGALFRNPPVGPFFANMDEPAFYRAVANRLGTLAAEGRRFPIAIPNLDEK